MFKLALRYLCMAGFACGLYANTVVFTLNSPFTGKLSPSWTSPGAQYMQASLTDLAPNTVQLTMDTTNLATGQKIGAWFFNVAPTFNPSVLNFAWVSGAKAQGITKGVDCCKADGTGGYFDIKFDFFSSDAKKFAAGTTSVFNISGTGLTASLFQYKSDPMGQATATPYYSAAHVLNLPGDQSTWIGTPEPGSYLLMSTAVAALIGFTRLRRRKT